MDYKDNKNIFSPFTVFRIATSLKKRYLYQSERKNILIFNLITIRLYAVDENL